MNEIIKKVPLPLSGVMLGLAALGNLLQSYSEEVRLFCGALAGICLILLLLKLILFPKMIKEDFKNPIMASVAGTFSMALMLLSVYVKPFIGQAAYIIWLFAIVLHILLILYFTAKFMIKPQMPKVFASYFIVYVGIAAASITAPAYGMQTVGTAAFWFGFVTLILLLLLITLRYVKYKAVPEPARALICIYAAPASLCAAGYIQSVQTKSYGLTAGLLLLATILYLFAIVKAASYLKLPFYPSLASFTFPFVISAIAVKQSMAAFANMGHPLPALRYLVLAETVIAVVMVLYTTIRYAMFIFGSNKAHK